MRRGDFLERLHDLADDWAIELEDCDEDMDEEVAPVDLFAEFRAFVLGKLSEDDEDGEGVVGESDDDDDD